MSNQPTSSSDSTPRTCVPANQDKWAYVLTVATIRWRTVQVSVWGVYTNADCAITRYEELKKEFKKSNVFMERVPLNRNLFLTANGDKGFAGKVPSS